MRVLLISGMYQKAGAISGAYIHRQMVELREVGVDVTVLCPVPRFARNDGAAERVRKALMRASPVELDGIRVTYLPYANLPNRVSAGFIVASLERRLSRHVRSLDRDFDLVHANRLFPQGCAAVSLAERMNVPVVVGVQGSDIHTNPLGVAAVGRYTRATIRRARLYAVSRELARQVEAFALPAYPIRIVYNGVDVTQFRPLADRSGIRARLALPATGTGICTVSRLVAEKGLWELLEAFERLGADAPDVWLAIVGDGPLRAQLENRIRSGPLAQRVVLAGAQPNASIQEWLNACDAFVLASHNEGLPNVILEAMACGLPVIATDVGGVREAMIDGTTGMLVPAKDPAALASALRSIASDEGMRQRMGQRGLQRVRRQFLWSQSAHSLRSLYEEVLDEKAAA